MTQVAEMAHTAGAVVVMDGAGGAHQPIDVQTWGPTSSWPSPGTRCARSGVGTLWGVVKLLGITSASTEAI